jgi:hypothetical protein
MKREKAARCPAGFPQRIPSAFECDYRLFPKQSLMRLVEHPLTPENFKHHVWGGLSSRSAGQSRHPLDASRFIFGTVPHAPGGASMTYEKVFIFRGVSNLKP